MLSKLELLSLIGFAFALVGLVFLLRAAAKFVLDPALIAAQRIQAPVQFQIVDFFYLSIQVQLAIAPIAAFVSRQQPLFFRAIVAFGFLASIGLWAGSVHFLSTAGVRTPLKRALFILVYLPGALAVTIGLPLLAIMNLVYLENDLFNPFPRERNTSLMFLVDTAAVIAIAAAAIMLRRLGVWLVSNPRVQYAAEPIAPPTAAPQGT